VLLEVCLIELCTLPTATQVEGLIRRLESLEARLTGDGARAAAPAAGAAAPIAAAPAAPRTRAAEPPRVRPAEARVVEPAPTIEPAREEDPVLRWRQAVDRVKDRKLLLGTCLEEGLFLGLAGSNVRVALSAEHAFHRAMIEMRENREILNEEMERHYGRGTTLVCVSGDAAIAGSGQAARPAPAGNTAAGVAAAELAEAADRAAAGEAGAAPSQSLVQRIVDLFDGEILEPGPQGSGA
jgi:hypothetical protein